MAKGTREEKAEENKAKILAFLAGHELDQSVTTICEAVGLSDVTAAKYLRILEAEGKVSSRVAGSAVLFRIMQGGTNERSKGSAE